MKDYTLFSGGSMLEMEGERQKRLINQLGCLQREISELEKSKSKLRQNLNLQKSEISKYKILLENLPQGVFYKDINSFYISCNRQYALELGISAEDIYGKTDFDLYPRKVARYYEEADKEVIASGGAVESDYEFIQYGKEKILRITKIPVRNERDDIMGILGISSDITSARRAQEELKKSEESFRLAFENAKDAIIWIDAEKGTIIRCNRSAEKLVEREGEELIGSHQLLLYPPEKAEYYDQLIRKQMQVDSTVDEEAEIITKSGKIVPVHMTSSVTSVGGTQIIQGILRDISEKKSWEQEILRRDIIMNAVRFSAESFMKIDVWENAITGILEKLGLAVNASRVYVYELLNDKQVTRRYEWVAPGVAPLCQDPLHHCLTWRNEGLKTWEEILKANQPVLGNVKDFPPSEHNFLTNLGVQSILIVPIFVNEKPWGLIGFVDCREERVWSNLEMDSLKASASVLGVAIKRGQALKAIQESESRFHSITQSANDAIICSDLAGTILYWNDAAVRMCGYSAEEMLGKPITNIFPVNTKSFYSEIMEKASHKDDASPEKLEETLLIRKDGTTVPVEIVISTWDTGNGRLISTIARDITERKTAEQDLRRVREDFVTTLTHDMKGPLTATLGYLHLLEKPQFGFISEEKKGFVNMIRHNQGVMLSMIENIIDSSTFEAGRMQYKFCSFPLQELVNELPITFGAMAVLAKVTLNLQCPDDAWVYADRKAIRRILNNLVSNAMRYTPQEGTITVSVVEEENRQKVMVKDTGKGISPEDMETIFQKYGKARGERRGTGLGLFIVKNFLKEHNSEIHAESEPGKGSTFYFSLEKAVPPHSFTAQLRD